MLARDTRVSKYAYMHVHRKSKRTLLTPPFRSSQECSLLLDTGWADISLTRMGPLENREKAGIGDSRVRRGKRGVLSWYHGINR